jgi:hypothetical protein
MLTSPKMSLRVPLLPSFPPNTDLASWVSSPFGSPSYVDLYVLVSTGTSLDIDLDELQRQESRTIQDAQATMQRIGTQLINDRKTAHLLQDVPKCDVPISRDIVSVLGVWPIS